MSATTTPNCSNPKLARGTPGTAGSSFGGKSYDITFTGLCFDVEDRATGKEKRILTNVSGMASAGRMLAIMGASGAGKTTLVSGALLGFVWVWKTSHSATFVAAP